MRAVLGPLPDGRGSLRCPRQLAAILLIALSLSGCGYHVSGHADTLPTKIKTIAIPAFGNLTTRYRLTEQVPAALTREFITRTRYEVIADEQQADAILRGAIVNYSAFPNIADQQTGRAAGVQVSVALQITLYDRATGNVLFRRPYMEFRNRYEIGSDQVNYFDESEPALERLSRDVARTVVSAILEAF